MPTALVSGPEAALGHWPAFDTMLVDLGTEALTDYAALLEEEGDPKEAAVYRLATTLKDKQLGETNALAELFGIPVAAFHRLNSDDAVKASFYEATRQGCHVKTARKLVEWFEANRASIERAARAHEREKAWLEAAAAGDPLGLLHHPRTRGLVFALAAGERPTGDRISDYCPKRKAVAAAKSMAADRLIRRKAHEVAMDAREGCLNRFHEAWLMKLRFAAVAAGREYHRRVKKLYQSKRADVIYGPGGQDDSSRPYGGSFKGWKASWKHAGARLNNEVKPSFVILENFRGTEMARLPIDQLQ
jgi:hypothetical protein